MNKRLLILTGAAAALLLLHALDGDEGATAGDEEANFLEDGADNVMSMINGWPTGSAPYRTMIEAAAAKNGVPVLLLAWLLWKESRYNPAIIDGTKRSRVGAMGIAQFMPATAREELGSEAAALDPARAIPGAARYLAKLFRALGGGGGGGLVAGRPGRLQLGHRQRAA